MHLCQCLLLTQVLSSSKWDISTTFFATLQKNHSTLTREICAKKSKEKEFLMVHKTNTRRKKKGTKSYCSFSFLRRLPMYLASYFDGYSIKDPLLLASLKCLQFGVRLKWLAPLRLRMWYTTVRLPLLKPRLRYTFYRTYRETIRQNTWKATNQAPSLSILR